MEKDGGPVHICYVKKHSYDSCNIIIWLPPYDSHQTKTTQLSPMFDYLRTIKDNNKLLFYHWTSGMVYETSKKKNAKRPPAKQIEKFNNETEKWEKYIW